MEGNDSQKVEAAFVDDFGHVGKVEVMTVKDVERRNMRLDELGQDEAGYWLVVRRLPAIVLLLSSLACAPLPKEAPQGDVSLEECQRGNPRCILCVDNKTGEGEWYSDVPACPDGMSRVILPKMNMEEQI